MGEMVGFIVWHLLRGYSIQHTEALFDQRFGAPPAGTWADAYTYAAQAMAATGNFLNAPMNVTLDTLVPPFAQGYQQVTVRATALFVSPSGEQIYQQFDRPCATADTVGDCWADLLTAAAEVAAEYDWTVGGIWVVPPLM